jgi:hypothetical protein
MDISKHIATNQTALRQVVAEIFALLELALDGTVKHLPQVLYHAALRLLTPAEAALRRLIFVAALGMVVKMPAPRQMTKGKLIQSKGTGPLSFQLFDTRKKFDRKPTRDAQNKVEPRIHTFDYAPLVPHKLNAARLKPKFSKICRRYAALKLALENIPHQARRMALWHQKRQAKVMPKFRFALRVGPPPGARRKASLEIDHLLKSCQELAFSITAANTS